MASAREEGVGASGARAGGPAEGHAEQAWNSAFYQFAEGVRLLSHGAVNYKVLYATVGTRGRYINHESAAVRRRTAANLSRLMHSCRYAEDMRKRYAVQPDVFTCAAAELAERLRASAALETPDLLEALLGSVWDGVRDGLANECEVGRADVSLSRADSEHANLATWARATARVGGDPVRDLLAAYFHILAFGSIDERLSRTLVAPTPAFADEGDPRPAATPKRVDLDAARPPAADGAGEAEPAEGFLAKLIDGDEHAISAIWAVRADKPFTLGRYTDCDVIDSYPYVSRLHCRIYRLDGRWYVEDAASLHGTRVLVRGEGGSWRQAFDSLHDRAGALVCELGYGDVIELAGEPRYLFGRFSPRESSPGAGSQVLDALGTADGSMEREEL